MFGYNLVAHVKPESVFLVGNPKAVWIIDVRKAGSAGMAFCIPDKIFWKRAEQVMRGITGYKDGINYENKIF
jgi:hypothetical protein